MLNLETLKNNSSYTIKVDKQTYYKINKTINQLSIKYAKKKELYKSENDNLTYNFIKILILF